MPPGGARVVTDHEPSGAVLACRDQSAEVQPLRTTTISPPAVSVVAGGVTVMATAGASDGG